MIRIFGSYEALEGGHARDALVNMTGGVGEDITMSDYTDSSEKKKKLFKILKSSIKDGSLISASISVRKKILFLIRRYSLWLSSNLKRLEFYHF